MKKILLLSLLYINCSLFAASDYLVKDLEGQRYLPLLEGFSFRDQLARVLTISHNFNVSDRDYIFDDMPKLYGSPFDVSSFYFYAKHEEVAFQKLVEIFESKHLLDPQYNTSLIATVVSMDVQDLLKSVSKHPPLRFESTILNITDELKIYTKLLNILNDTVPNISQSDIPFYESEMIIRGDIDTAIMLLKKKISILLRKYELLSNFHNSNSWSAFFKAKYMN